MGYRSWVMGSWGLLLAAGGWGPGMLLKACNTQDDKGSLAPNVSSEEAGQESSGDDLGKPTLFLSKGREASVV